MAAGITNLLIEQGSTFTRKVTIKDNQVVPAPIDLTGYIARASMRPTADSSTVTVAFTCNIPTPANGEVVLSLTASETALIPTTGKTAYDKLAKFQWDMEIEVGGVVTRILNGSVEVSPEVTRA